MNIYFAAAGLLAFVVGLAHSVLGEILVFSRMRQGGFIPTNGGQILRERHVRILWASWHALTVFGWGMAALLFWLSQPSVQEKVPSFLADTIIASAFFGALVVLIGTNGKHPGWIGLLGVAILTFRGLFQ